MHGEGNRYEKLNGAYSERTHIRGYFDLESQKNVIGCHESCRRDLNCFIEKGGLHPNKSNGNLIRNIENPGEIIDVNDVEEKMPNIYRYRENPKKQPTAKPINEIIWTHYIALRDESKIAIINLSIRDESKIAIINLSIGNYGVVKEVLICMNEVEKDRGISLGDIVSFFRIRLGKN